MYLSAFLPKAVIVLLLLGGVYLAYEGVEKIYEFFFKHKQANEIDKNLPDTEEEVLIEEKKKIKSAIITD